MKNIDMIISFILISLFLSGCIGEGNGAVSDSGTAVSDNRISNDSLLNYHVSSAPSGDFEDIVFENNNTELLSNSGSSGESTGHYNPEPMSLVLLGSGLLGLLTAKFKKRGREAL